MQLFQKLLEAIFKKKTDLLISQTQSFKYIPQSGVSSHEFSQNEIQDRITKMTLKLKIKNNQSPSRLSSRRCSNNSQLPNENLLSEKESLRPPLKVQPNLNGQEWDKSLLEDLFVIKNGEISSFSQN